MGVYILVIDGEPTGYIMATSLGSAKKKIDKISKKSDGYLPTADEFDKIVEVKKYR